MYRIVDKKVLNPTVVQLQIEAPLVANKARPGQFIILRVDEDGERIPLTVAGCNPLEGSVKIIFQIVGATTHLLNQKEAGDSICDFVGPLGVPTEHEGATKVCVVGGGTTGVMAAVRAARMGAKRIRSSADLPSIEAEKISLPSSSREILAILAIRSAVRTSRSVQVGDLNITVSDKIAAAIIPAILAEGSKPLS